MRTILSFLVFFISFNSFGLQIRFEPDRAWNKNEFHFSQDVWEKGNLKLVVRKKSNIFFPSAKRMTPLAIRKIQEERSKNQEIFGRKEWKISSYKIDLVDGRDDVFWVEFEGNFQKKGKRHFVERILYSPDEIITIRLTSPFEITAKERKEILGFVSFKKS